MTNEDRRPPPGPTASFSVADALAREFESEWRSGSRPSLEEFLARAPLAGRGEVLARLLRLEMTLAGENGETLSLRAYRQRFTEFRDVVEGVIAEYASGSRSPPRSGAEGSSQRPNQSEVNTRTAPASGSAGRSGAGSTPRFTHVGDYEILEEIARGGMGVVYRARQRKLNRVVALKMILAGQFATDEDVRRFYSEAEAAAKLDHVGIVPIYEVNEHEGHHYYSMGFVDGESLQQRVSRGPLPQREAATLVRQIAEAVHYAHTHGVVHRDLKPRNILLTAEGQPKVTDFGLAKRIDGHSELTVSGQILGTPGYMPPEQALGKLEGVGPHSDVYSLGGVLYCLLAARPPFHGATAVETIKLVLEAPPVAPRLLNPGLARDLDTICLKCLEKDPAHRYGSAAELAEELGRYLEGEPIRARRTSALTRSWRWVRRRPLAAALALSLVLLALAVAGTVHVVRQASASNRLAELKREVDSELAAPDASLAYLERLDQKIANLAAVDASAAHAASARSSESFTQAVRNELRQPVLEPLTALVLAETLEVFAQRDAARAAQLRSELASRQRDWQRVFLLAPPFAEADAILAPRSFQREGSTRLLPRGTTDPSHFRVATQVSSGGAVRLEARFDPTWEQAKKIGLSLNSRQGKGYDFWIRTEPALAADDEFSPAATDQPQAEPTFGEARQGNYHYVLAIYRNGMPVKRVSVHQSEVALGPLVMKASREAGRLALQINELARLEFYDPFPLPATEDGVFALRWPGQVGLVSLLAERKPKAEATSPLEEGDALFEQQAYHQALELYQQQARETQQEEFRLESRHKQGLCLLHMGRVDDAAAVFEELLNAPGERWPPLAGCYLWIIRLRQKRTVEADALFDLLASKYRFEEFGPLIPQELRQEILAAHPRALVSISSLLQHNPALIERQRRLVAVDRFLSRDGKGDDLTQIDVARAYNFHGDLPNALITAEKVAAGTRNSIVLKHYLRLLRLTGQPERALFELSKYDERVPQWPSTRDNTLLIERARIFAALEDYERCEQTIDPLWQRGRIGRGAPQFAFTHVALMKGMLLDRRGAHGPALAAWREGYEVVRELMRKEPRVSSEFVNGLILGSLSQGMSEQEAQEHFANLVNRGGDNGFTLQAQSLANPKVIASALCRMWRSPLGRHYAEAFAFETISLRERARIPLVLAATEFWSLAVEQGGASPARREVVFAASELLYDQITLEGKLSFAQMAPLLLTWKGTTGFLGWSGVASSLEQAARANLAFVFGHRFLAQGDTPQALKFLAIARQEGARGSPLVRQAELDERLLKGQLAQIHITSEAPDEMKLVLHKGDEAAGEIVVREAATWEGPAGTYRLSLEPADAAYTLEPASLALRPAALANVKIAWRWKPASPGTALAGLLPAPAPGALGDRWQLYYRYSPQESLAFAWSGDGRQFAVATADAAIRVYDATSRKLQAVLPAGPSYLRGLVWAPHSTTLLASGFDKQLSAWNAATGEPLFERTDLGHDTNALSWNGGATQFLLGGASQPLRQWQSTGELLGTLGPGSAKVDALAFSPNGAVIAARSYAEGPPSLLLWNAASRESRSLPGAGQGPPPQLAFSPDSRRLACGHATSSIQLWEVDGTVPLATIAYENHPLTKLQWLPDGRRLMATTTSNLVLVFDMAASPPALATRQEIGEMYRPALSPAGTQIVFTKGTREIGLASVGEGTPVEFGSPAREVLAMAVQPGEAGALAVGGRDATVRLFDRKGRQLRAWAAPRGRVNCLAWNADGTLLAGALAGGFVVLWKAEGTQHSEHATPIIDKPHSLAFMATGQNLVLAGRDRQVHRLDINSGKLEPLPGRARGDLLCLATCPAGTFAAGDSDGQIQVWNAQGNAPGAFDIFPKHSVEFLAFSPSGERLAARHGDRRASLWTAEGKRLGELPDSVNRELALAWSPGGQKLLTTAYDGHLRVWNGAREVERQLAVPHYGRTNVALWLDEDLAVSGGDDGSLRFWSPATGQPGNVALLLPQEQWALFSPSGKRIEASTALGDEFVYGRETSTGALELISPLEFERRLNERGQR